MRQAPACRSAQGSSAGFGHWRGARLCLRPKNEVTFGPMAPAMDLNPKIRLEGSKLLSPGPDLNPIPGPWQLPRGLENLLQFSPPGRLGPR